MFHVLPYRMFKEESSRILPILCGGIKCSFRVIEFSHKVLCTAKNTEPTNMVTSVRYY